MYLKANVQGRLFFFYVTFPFSQEPLCFEVHAILAHPLHNPVYYLPTLDHIWLHSKVFVN